MSTQHVTHLIYEPGLPGDGFTAPDAAQIRAQVEASVAAIGSFDAKIERINTRTYDIRDYVSDTTGATDMRAQLLSMRSALPQGAVLTIPAGVVIQSSGYVPFTKRISVTGDGEIVFTGNGDAFPSARGGIMLQAAFSSISGVKLTNPNGSGPFYGVWIEADHVHVHKCRVDNWQNGINQTFNNGEWRGAIITQNIVTNVYGSAVNENQGTGIMIAGSDAIVADNIVRAKPGVDTWIGIAMEGLDSQSPNKIYSNNTDVTSSSQMCVNNIVEGNFRRSIHTEGNQHSLIDGNTVYGFRWWGIVAWNAQSATITNNKVHFTNTSAVPGAPPLSYANEYCGILALVANSISIEGNTITLASNTNWTSGICLLPSAASSTKNRRHLIKRNTIECGNRAMPAIKVDAATGAKTVIHDNDIEGGASRGIQIRNSATATFVISNNRIEATVALIDIDGFFRAFIHDNTTLGAGSGTTGIVARNGTITVIKHNTIIDVNVGVDGTGTTQPYAPGNTFIGVTTRFFNVTNTTAYGPAA